MGLLAFEDAEAGAAAQHAVEFIFEEIDALVEIIGSNIGDEVLAADFDETLGHIFLGAIGEVVGAQFNTDAYDMGFVFKELTDFFDHGGLEGCGQVEVVTADDDILATITHDLSFPLVSG